MAYCPYTIRECFSALKCCTACEETFYICLEMDCIPRYRVWGWRNMWGKQIRGFHLVNILPMFQIAARRTSVCWPGSRGAEAIPWLPSLGGNQGHWTPSHDPPCSSLHFLKVGKKRLPPAPNQPARRYRNQRQQRATARNTCFMLYPSSAIAHANEIAIHSELGYDQ